MPLRRVIAQRELVDDQTGTPVTVSIGTPQYIGDGWDWVCPFKIDGVGSPIHGHVHGIDALQTLQLVSLEIRASLEKHGGKFTFLDNPFWQSGFPKPVRCLGVQELEKRMEEVLTQEETQWVKGHRGALRRSPRIGDQEPNISLHTIAASRGKR